MRGRVSRSGTWTTETANDNEPSREIAAEGVLHCLRFLATETNSLGYCSAASDVLRAVFTLEAELEAGRDGPGAPGGQALPPGRSLPPVRVPRP